MLINKQQLIVELQSVGLKLASAETCTAYFALRRAIFAQEQQLFLGNDRDEVDKIAYPNCGSCPK